MSWKREIALLASEKGLEHLDLMIDCCFGIHGLKGFLEGASRLDARERISDSLLNIVKHPSDDGRV